MQLTIRYFAVLREQRGLSVETLESEARTASELYSELQIVYGLSVPITSMRVAINDEFASMDQPLNDRDEIAFIAPVAGG